MVNVNNYLLGELMALSSVNAIYCYGQSISSLQVVSRLFSEQLGKRSRETLSEFSNSA